MARVLDLASRASLQRSRITSRITECLELQAGKAISMITIHTGTTGKSGKVRVTFEMSATQYCDGLYLVGWFNEWDETVYRMERTKDDKWSLTLELEPGCEYQYRYRTPDGKWLQDPSSPAPAQFGLNSSFLVTSESMA